MKHTMIVFMGGQGSGKGTFAHLLLKRQHFNYVEAGEILRAMPDDSPIRKKIGRGELLTDFELFPIMSKHITTDSDLILDGFPRTLGQAKWLIDNFSDSFNIKIIFLDITEDKMIAHIQKRLREGGTRSDDADETAVHKRIESFRNTTMPAIEWLRNNSSVQFFDIKLPSDDIDSNFELVLNALK